MGQETRLGVLCVKPGQCGGERDHRSQSMGQETRVGNNTTLCLDVDSTEEADRLYGALSEGGSEGSPMADVP
jgi:uncharacterized glyoxalase superfamily protein PhnB